MDITADHGIETTLVRDVLPVKQAQLLAGVVGADVNDLYFNEPTMADYQIITSPIPPLPPGAAAPEIEERARTEAAAGRLFGNRNRQERRGREGYEDRASGRAAGERRREAYKHRGGHNDGRDEGRRDGRG